MSVWEDARRHGCNVVMKWKLVTLVDGDAVATPEQAQVAEAMSMI